jgi:hypothetical protein
LRNILSKIAALATVAKVVLGIAALIVFSLSTVDNSSVRIRGRCSKRLRDVLGPTRGVWWGCTSGTAGESML